MLVKWHNRTQAGPELKVETFHSYEFKAVWGGTEPEVLHQSCYCEAHSHRTLYAPALQAIAKVHDFFESPEFVDGIPLVPGAKEAMRRLHDTGLFRMVLVTSRQSSLEAVTRAWLEQHFEGVSARGLGRAITLACSVDDAIMCVCVCVCANQESLMKSCLAITMACRVQSGNTVYHATRCGDCNSRHPTARFSSKPDLCKELGARVIVDDRVKYARTCSPVVDKVILFGKYAWNGGIPQDKPVAGGPEDSPLPDNVVRVTDWKEAEALLLQLVSSKA